MKKSLGYLPAQRREDMELIVKLARKKIKDLVMVILYGSYARGDYVEYDERIEYGIPTTFRSDYDILLVTEKVKSPGTQHNVFTALERDFGWVRPKEYTAVQFICEDITRFNEELAKGRYFFVDIKKEGVMLWDSGRYKLARRRQLNYSEIFEMAQEYYDEHFRRVKAFEVSARAVYDLGDYKTLSFFLHQETENLFHAIALVYSLYTPKEHRLPVLLGRAKNYLPDAAKPFPYDTKEEKRLFDLLRDAYVQARYNAKFKVTKEDIDALAPKVGQLRAVTEQACRERLDFYASRVRCR